MYSIVAVSETWLQGEIQDSEIHIDGYTVIRQDRSGRGGGVAIYIKQNLKYLVINLDVRNFEILAIRLNLNNRNIIFATIYRPPGYTNIRNFLDEFDEIVSSFSMECDHLIITGDFNINMMLLDNLHVISFTDTLSSYSLNQIVTQPTRIGLTNASLLDLIICSSNLETVSSEVITDVDIADHFWIDSVFKICVQETQPEFHSLRNLKNIDMYQFNRDLESIPFYNIYRTKGINNKLTLFNNYIIQLFDKHAPLRIVRIKHKRKPWVTENIRLIQKLRDKALHTFKKNKTEHAWSQYKYWRNFANSSLYREKKAYLNSQLAKGSKNEKWRILKQLDVIKSKKTNVPEHLSIPDKINEYFASIMNSNLEPDDVTISTYAHSLHQQAGSFSFKMATINEVGDLIASIKSKAVGFDSIGIDMLTLCGHKVLPVICHLINTCIEHGCFPDIWKVSFISPIPKVNSPKDFNDLRPISILPCLSKIAEKFLSKQITDYLNSCNILPSFQSGFRSQHSCATALLKIIDDILHATDENKITALILLDYSKAFDKINHKLLLAILKYVGISESSLRLMTSYLEDRQQIVRVKETYSCPIGVSCGVPQGSILGPILFCIYTSQLVSCLQHCSAHLYADDTQLYFSFPANQSVEACNRITDDLNNLSRISIAHCLELNPQKCSVMLLGREKSRRSVVQNFSININGEPLQLVESAKNLGVELDTSLRLNGHINKSIARAFSKLKVLYSQRKILNKKTKQLLCDCLILSNFNHCDVVYNACISQRDSSRIQSIQNACVRLVCGIPRRQHVSSSISEIGWLKMRDRRLLHCLVLFHKIIKYKTPVYLHEKIIYRAQTHTIRLNLRSDGLISAPRHRTAIYQRSFTYCIYKLYNQVPQNIRHLSVTSFKKKCKYLIGNFEL
nr:unnamed protein product [Callosobruchus analis]